MHFYRRVFYWKHTSGKIRTTSGPFDTLTNEDVNDVIDSRLFTVVCANSQFFYTIKIKLQGGLKIWILHHLLHLFAILFFNFTCSMYSIPLQNKIHIFAHLCSILYVVNIDSHVKMKSSLFPFKVLANITTEPNCLKFRTRKNMTMCSLLTKVL